MSKEVKHTETPFQIGDSGVNVWDKTFTKVIAVCETGSTSEREQISNARFIVTACNNHDKLVEALKGMANSIHKDTGQVISKHGKDVWDSLVIATKLLSQIEKEG